MQYNTGIAMQIISTKKVVQYSNTGKFAKMVHQYFFFGEDVGRSLITHT